VLPFIHVFAKSVSVESAVIANKVFLWPQGFDITAYQKVLADSSIIRSFFVSVLTTVLFTALGMLITLCAAYPLSRRDLIARKGLTMFFMITMYFSGGMIPEYLLIDSLGLLDTLAAMILPLAFSAYNLLIMKTSLQASIPESLIEAAHMEGASEFKILTKIVIPLSKPVIATLILFYAVGRWNAYSDALFYIKRNIDIRPLQLKLYYLVVASTEAVSETVGTVRQHTNPEVLKAASIIFATVPILCVYPFVQNYFVQGTMIGAVKE
jgi:putative aldouronate transport system permease protein